MDTIEKLEKNGIDPTYVAVRINAIALLGDVMEACAIEVEAKLRLAKFQIPNSDLLDIIAIKQAAKRLRKPVDKHMTEMQQEGFGCTSDELREVIFEFLKK